MQRYCSGNGLTFAACSSFEAQGAVQEVVLPCSPRIKSSAAAPRPRCTTLHLAHHTSCIQLQKIERHAILSRLCNSVVTSASSEYGKQRSFLWCTLLRSILAQVVNDCSNVRIIACCWSCNLGRLESGPRLSGNACIYAAQNHHICICARKKAWGTRIMRGMSVETAFCCILCASYQLHLSHMAAIL